MQYYFIDALRFDTVNHEILLAKLSRLHMFSMFYEILLISPIQTSSYTSI